MNLGEQIPEVQFSRTKYQHKTHEHLEAEPSTPPAPDSWHTLRCNQQRHHWPCPQVPHPHSFQNLPGQLCHGWTTLSMEKFSLISNLNLSWYKLRDISRQQMMSVKTRMDRFLKGAKIYCPWWQPKCEIFLNFNLIKEGNYVPNTPVCYCMLRPIQRKRNWVVYSNYYTGNLSALCLGKTRLSFGTLGQVTWSFARHKANSKPALLLW